MSEKLGNAGRGQEMKVEAGAHRWQPGARGMKVGAVAHRWGPGRVGGGRDASVRAGGRGLELGTRERGGSDAWVAAGTHGSAPGHV